MPHAVEVRVVPRNLRWEVVADGVTRRMIDWLCTKERAIDHALERAKEFDAVAVVVEHVDGSVGEVIPIPRPQTRHLRLA